MVKQSLSSLALISMIALISFSCGKSDLFQKEQKEESSAVVSQGRNLVLNGNLQLDDIKVGDTIRLEVETWEVRPKFRDEHRFLTPDFRDDMGCWASYRFFVEMERIDLTPLDGMKMLQLFVDGEARPLLPWVKEVKWSNGIVLYDLLITPELAERDTIEIEFKKWSEQKHYRIGFQAITSKCIDYVYQDISLNPTKLAYVDQVFFTQKMVKMSYQLLR